MGYIPNQRPGGPGSFNNWQGQYDVPAELPNVAGSATQLGVPNVQAGDVAWVTGGTPGLYVCTDPTEGAAVWELVTIGGGTVVQSGTYQPTLAAANGEFTPSLGGLSWNWIRIGSGIFVTGLAQANNWVGAGSDALDFTLPFTPAVGLSQSGTATVDEGTQGVAVKGGGSLDATTGMISSPGAGLNATIGLSLSYQLS